MRRIACLALLLVLIVPALARAEVAPPPAVGRVAGATVAVSGVPAPARGAAVAEAADAPAARAAPASAAPVARAAAGASVAIRDFDFGPATITVHVGDTVIWSNAGPTAHTATANDRSFDTGELRAGQSGSHTFASAGTFAYHCSLHPFMRGTVQVVAAASGGGAGGGGSTAAGAAPPGAASGGTTTAGGAPAPAAAAAPTGPTLPRTGLDAPWLAGLGALVLLCGVVLRARTRPR